MIEKCRRSWWMGDQSEVSSYNGILFDHKAGWLSGACSTVDEFWMMMLGRSQPQRPPAPWLHNKQSPEQGAPSRQKKRDGTLQNPRKGEYCMIVNEHGGFTNHNTIRLCWGLYNVLWTYLWKTESQTLSWIVTLCEAYLSRIIHTQYGQAWLSGFSRGNSWVASLTQHVRIVVVPSA